MRKSFETHDNDDRARFYRTREENALRRDAQSLLRLVSDRYDAKNLHAELRRQFHRAEANDNTHSARVIEAFARIILNNSQLSFRD